MSLLVRQRAVVVAGTAAAAAALVVGAALPATAASNTKLSGGTAVLTTNPGVIASLTKLSVTLGAVAPATKATVTVSGKPVPAFTFPASNGIVDTAAKNGFVKTTGALTFTAGGKTVTFANLSFHYTTDSVIADVAGSRNPALRLDTSAATWAATATKVNISNVKVRLSAIGAGALNKGLGLKGAFTSDFVLGNVRISANIAP